MIDNPVKGTSKNQSVFRGTLKPIIDDVRGIALGNGFHQISFGDNRLTGIAPLFTLFRRKTGLEILYRINRSMDAVPERFKLKMMAWNGVIFKSAFPLDKIFQ